MMRLRACALVMVVVGGFGAAAGSAPASASGVRAGHAAAAVPGFTSADGIQVTSQTALDPRLLALTVTTSALDGPANVRVLLPADYAAYPDRRYPVLYLLHGTSGGAADWTTMGAAEQTTAGQPLIVVMPDIAQHDNGGGWCTNSYNGGAYGPPEWETFHIDQLIPWIDHNLRTIANRGGRAIAGLSQGGFCSMSYAARHPDLFSAALSFSGAPDIAYDAEAQALVTPIINATETGLDGVAPNSLFGPRMTEEINWAAHDPTTLAENLRGMRLIIYTGNGQPGPFDPLLPNLGADVIEGGVNQLSTLFHNRLDALGIPSTFDDYGPGTHSWPYWKRDLEWSIGAVMSNFAHPAATSASITYTSADPVYTVFGWQVSMQRAVREFSTLQGAGPNGFTLLGSGSATVLTPARYPRNARYRITLRSSAQTTSTTARTGGGHRLSIPVTLGPTNTVQEYPADGPAVGTTVYATRVSIRRLPARRHRRLPARRHRR
jgi:S-formylglutathione hydrolase FrmB